VLWRLPLVGCLRGHGVSAGGARAGGSAARLLGGRAAATGGAGGVRHLAAPRLPAGRGAVVRRVAVRPRCARMAQSASDAHTLAGLRGGLGAGDEDVQAHQSRAARARHNLASGPPQRAADQGALLCAQPQLCSRRAAARLTRRAARWLRAGPDEERRAKQLGSDHVSPQRCAC